MFGVTRGLSTKYAGRVCNSALSESTIVGTAIGRALAGQRPVAFIQFADFLPLAYNQLTSELAFGLTVQALVIIVCPWQAHDVVAMKEP